MPQPVFADVDTGVDDAMALVYLLASPEAELVGIACTAGNVPVQQVCENNLRLLELCRVEGIPVSKGSEQPVSTPLRTRKVPIRDRENVTMMRNKFQTLNIFRFSCTRTECK